MTWEDLEAQKREWDKEVGKAYMNEMLEDCPSNGPLWALGYLSEGEGMGGGLAMSGLGGSDP